METVEANKFLLLNYIEYLNLLHMPENSLKLRPSPGMDTLEGFTGWQNKEVEEGSSIFNKLKNNLHAYEKKYQFFHNHSKENLQKISSLPKPCHNKENHQKQTPSQMPCSQRLPPIRANSLDKTFRNLQAIVYYEFIKNQPIHPLKERKNDLFCEVTTKRLTERDLDLTQKHSQKKNRPRNFSRVLNCKSRKAETKLNDYEFSDQKFMNNMRIRDLKDCYSCEDE